MDNDNLIFIIFVIVFIFTVFFNEKKEGFHHYIYNRYVKT